jgi:membrane protein YqaA with SNARE-associated domain
LEDIDTASQLLSEQPGVQWVEVLRKKQLHNIWAASVTQVGSIAGVPPGYAAGTYMETAMTSTALPSQQKSKMQCCCDGQRQPM